MPYVERGNTKVHYEVHGRAEGEVLVLLHSLGTSSRLWDRQIGPFGERFKIVAVDARGHGKTESSEPFRMKAWAEDIVAVLDHLGIDKAHFLGLSMGGHAVMELYTMIPERLQKLMLCNTFPKVQEEIREERIKSRLELLKQPDFVTEWAKLSVHPGASQELIAETVKLWGCTLDSYAEAWVEVMNVDYVRVISKIEKPTLILTGDQDRSAPLAAAEGMHRLIAGSKLSLVENAGHLSNLSNPEQFNRLILDFLG